MKRFLVFLVLVGCVGNCLAYSAGHHAGGGGHGHVANGADAISFPGETHRRTVYSNDPTYANDTISYQANNLIPPLDFIQKLSNYNVSDLLLNYVDDYEEETLLANRFGEVERSQAIQPKAAACTPELQTIKLATQSDPSIIYIPSCTRIERCGGCCSHNLLSCQPVDTELVSFKVIKTQFAAGNRLKFVGKEVIHVEKHTKCHCGCRVQASDCSAVQHYSADECKCKCANLDEERKCHAKSGLKLWDYTSCSCRCRNVSQCTTGFMFDSNDCRCVSIPKRRHVIARPVIDENDKQQEEQFQFQQTIDEEYDF